MKKYKAFDVVGPVMVGPSSSHTAGACRIGNAALAIAGGKAFAKVDFNLHGSFASTYMGHGTDMALVGGICGIGPGEEKLRDSFAIAKEKGIEYTFIPMDLGDVHPNTVEIVFHYEDGESLSVTGSSIGGGNMVIVRINEIPVYFNNEFPTLILQYQEQSGIISYVSTILASNDYNIETIITKKEEDTVTLVVETTESVEKDLLQGILKSKKFTFAKYIDVLEGEEA